MGSLGEMLVSSWGFCWMPGEEESRASLLWDRDISSMRDHWKGRGGERVLIKPSQGYWPFPRSGNGSEVGGGWAEVSFLIHSPSHIYLPNPKKSIYQSYTSRMFFLAAHQQQHWQPDHLWAPGILAVLPASPHYPSPVPWPMAAIIILFRDVSGDKKQTETNGQPSCGPVSEAEHLYIALPEQVCCRGSRRPWPTQTTEERWTLSGIFWTPILFQTNSQSQCDFMNQGKTL